jgi:hypothetical protein
MGRWLVIFRRLGWQCEVGWLGDGWGDLCGDGESTRDVN